LSKVSLHKLRLKAKETGIPVMTLIDQAIARNDGNITYAARDLGVSRAAIYLRLGKRQRATVGAK
jgi:transcriptional regulator of acetoin/glycerol metabolism